MDYILTSLDMIAGITENLINYTFNVSSSCCTSLDVFVANWYD